MPVFFSFGLKIVEVPFVIPVPLAVFYKVFKFSSMYDDIGSDI